MAGASDEPSEATNSGERETGLPPPPQAESNSTEPIGIQRVVGRMGGVLTREIGGLAD